MTDTRTLKKITDLLAELSEQPNCGSFLDVLHTRLDILVPTDRGICVFEIIDGIPKCLRWPDYADYLIDAYNSYYSTLIPAPYSGVRFEKLEPVEWVRFGHTEYVTDFHRPLGVARTFGTVFHNRFRGKRHFIVPPRPSSFQPLLDEERTRCL
jgi:hypothetical protein